jgi:two-component sensor histidine kinase
MALQELATNAVKYGALSTSSGRVSVTWSVDRSRSPERPFRLAWIERGGPPVSAPERRGFGSRLIERNLAQDLEGEVEMVFAPTGVICTVEAPVPQPD